MIDHWHASFEDTTHIFEEIEHSFIKDLKILGFMSRKPLDWILKAHGQGVLIA